MSETAHGGMRVWGRFIFHARFISTDIDAKQSSQLSKQWAHWWSRGKGLLCSLSASRVPFLIFSPCPNQMLKRSTRMYKVPLGYFKYVWKICVSVIIIRLTWKLENWWRHETSRWASLIAFSQFPAVLIILNKQRPMFGLPTWFYGKRDSQMSIHWKVYIRIMHCHLNQHLCALSLLRSCWNKPCCLHDCSDETKPPVNHSGPKIFIWLSW